MARNKPRPKALTGQQRMEACAKEVNAALEKHGCIIMAIPRIDREGRVVAVASIELKIE